MATYTYQAYADTLASVKDGKGLSTTYRHDDFDRNEYLSQPMFFTAGDTRYYDARGNLLRRTARYVVADHTYDGLDRVLTQRASNSQDGTSVAYTYRYDEDGQAGRLTSVEEPDRTVRFGYDAAGRLVSETVEENGIAAPLVTTYAYDADGDLVEVGYPSGLRVAYDLHPATKEVVRVREVSGGGPFADSVTRLPGGPVTSLAFGNGLSLSQTFDLRYQPESVLSGPLSLGYTMSPSGDVAGMAEGETPRTFEYDFLDRLASSPGWLAYGYDGTGNRTTETVEGAAASYTYSMASAIPKDRIAKKQVPGASGNVDTHGFGYDYQLNVTTIGKYDAAGTTTLCLRHDALGRLVTVGTKRLSGFNPGAVACITDAEMGTVLARFKYDSRNRRIARWLASTGQWTWFANGPDGSVLSEVTLTSDPANPWEAARDYVWLDGRPLAQVERSGLVSLELCDSETRGG